MTSNSSVKRVVIAGGGNAGWITAAALSSKFSSLIDITLVESDQIGTVGVGEATIPTARTFHKLLGIDEQAFMRATNATFKLGISFEGWGQKGDKYIHSFGQTGQSSWLVDFHHFWLHANKAGIADGFGCYSLELQAALAGKFVGGEKSPLSYAYHLDATLYAKFLRELAESRGVKRVEGLIEAVNQDQLSGEIISLTLESKRLVEGDLFIDCTGFRALLIEQTLGTGFDDWSEYLPCNRAVAVQTDATSPPIPMTRSIAHEAGWRWKIPLQNRVGNGLVYSSEHLDDEGAITRLLGSISGKPLTEPKVIPYRSGMRRKMWNKNCIAIGLSTGFIEPLESTSIHLFMAAITKLMRLFPFDGINDALRDEFNRLAKEELESIRDFIVLHYNATERDDSPFWNQCRSMAIPDSLAHRMELFRSSAHAFQGGEELFRVDSWTQVMLGQGIQPKGFHHMVKNMRTEELTRFLGSIRNNINNTVASLPTHSHFLSEYCASS